jgi:hypothetical protein
MLVACEYDSNEEAAAPERELSRVMLTSVKIEVTSAHGY